MRQLRGLENAAFVGRKTAIFILTNVAKAIRNGGIL
jgi:hypothetical protein